MTDQTVSVPVDVLRKVHDFWGGSYAADESGIPDLLAIELPNPPKVGDKLTAEQVKALPVDALMVDAQGDAWMVRPGEKVLWFGDSDRLDNRQVPSVAWAPYTLVYLPDNA